MVKNLIIKADGTKIDSSSIISYAYRKSCNSGKNIRVGSVNVASVEFLLRGVNSQSISEGEEFTYYVILENGQKVSRGKFIASKLTRKTKNTYRLIGFDRISKLETDVSDWLRSIESQFPMNIQSLLEKTCSHVGLTVATKTFPNKDLMVESFSTSEITARTIVSWIAEIAGQFCTCDTNGSVVLDWYDPKATRVNKSDYKLGTLSYQEYTTAKIDRVQIRQSDKDVGVIYPPSATGNTYAIERNGLLRTQPTSIIQTVAMSLYDKLKDFQYVPATFQVSRMFSVGLGDSVAIESYDGTLVNSIVTEISENGGTKTCASRGDKTMGSPGKIANSKYVNLPGRMLEIETDIDGLRLEVSETFKDYSTTEETKSLIEASADSITLEVSKSYASNESVNNKFTDYDKQIRSKFALDPSSITIESGVISFKSNSIVIDSTNFSLDQTGNVTATGRFKSKSSDGSWSSTLSSGLFEMYHNNKRRVWLAPTEESNVGMLALDGDIDNKFKATYLTPYYLSMNVERQQAIYLGILTDDARRFQYRLDGRVVSDYYCQSDGTTGCKIQNLETDKTMLDLRSHQDGQSALHFNTTDGGYRILLDAFATDHDQLVFYNTAQKVRMKLESFNTGYNQLQFYSKLGYKRFDLHTNDDGGGQFKFYRGDSPTEASWLIIEPTSGNAFFSMNTDQTNRVDITCTGNTCELKMRNTVVAHRDNANGTILYTDWMQCGDKGPIRTYWAYSNTLGAWVIASQAKVK